ncbi:MAG: hypothetical protein AAF513_04495 [Pseudomonadota bacterium]
MSDAIVEIRDYTIEAEHFEAYKTWALTLAAPWLKANLDVIDFWMDDGIPPEVTGSNPQAPANGQANVCWIIRWPSKSARDENFAPTMEAEGWRAIWAEHPCPKAYLQMNVRFMKPAL